MSREDSLHVGRWQFSLRGLLLLTTVAATAAAGWLALGEFALFGVPFWCGLIAVSFSRRRGWVLLRNFVYGFWYGSLLLLILVCLIAFTPVWYAAP